MIRVVLQQSRRLDRDALAALIRQSSKLSLIAWLATDWETVAVAKLRRPDVAIVDTSLANDGAAALAKCLVHNGYASHVVLLSDGHDSDWDRKASEIARTSHITRNESLDDLISLILRNCSKGMQPVDTQLTEPHAMPTCDSRRLDAPVRNTLSPREAEVFRLLAEGFTLRQCAEKLSLAVSTVDNHKSRLMRKLNVHKTIDLVKIAIRQGIIIP